MSLAAHVDKILAEAKAREATGAETGAGDAWRMREAAELAKKGHYGRLGELLAKMDTEPRDAILENIHPDHHEKLGLPPIDKARSLKQYDDLHGPGLTGLGKKADTALHVLEGLTSGRMQERDLLDAIDGDRGVLDDLKAAGYISQRPGRTMLITAKGTRAVRDANANAKAKDAAGGGRRV